MRPEIAARYQEGDLLIITKTNRLSTVHRRVRLDYIGVRIIGPSGATLGEARLVGLFTSKAFMEPASHVPILRRKLADIVANEDLIEGSHDHKAVIQIFEGYSKHDLFTAPTAGLAEGKSWVCWRCRRLTRSGSSSGATSWSGAFRSSSPFLVTGSTPICGRRCRISS